MRNDRATRRREPTSEQLLELADRLGLLDRTQALLAKPSADRTAIMHHLRRVQLAAAGKPKTKQPRRSVAQEAAALGLSAHNLQEARAAGVPQGRMSRLLEELLALRASKSQVLERWNESVIEATARRERSRAEAERAEQRKRERATAKAEKRRGSKRTKRFVRPKLTTRPIRFSGRKVFRTPSGLHLLENEEGGYRLYHEGESSAGQRGFVRPGTTVRAIRVHNDYLEVARVGTAGTAWSNLGRLLAADDVEGVALVDQASVAAVGFLQPTQLDWVVLRPGWTERVARQERSARSDDPRRVKMDFSRIAFIDALAPETWFAGSHLGSVVYYVALFPHIAIADCIDFGNALYFVRRDRGADNWRSVFQLDKRSARSAGARRIVHTGAWQERVRSLVRTKP